MQLNQLQDSFNFAFAVLDGAYGWMSEAIGIFLLVFFFNFLMKWLLRNLHKRFKTQNKFWKDGFVTALYSPLSYYIWYFAVLHAIDLINNKVFEVNFFTNMHTLLSVGMIICGAWFLMSWKKNITKQMITKCKNHEIPFEQGKIDVINKVLTMVIFFLTILMVMEVTHQNMNTLIAFGGIGGLAIAFASQEIIANFFGGLMIYFNHSFTIGDWINLPEHHIEGHVEEIGWYMTRIRTFEKRPICIPNSFFSKAVVMTPSRMSHRQFKEIVGIRYADIPAAKKIIADLKEMLMNHPAIDHSQNTLVHLHSFGSYSVDILVNAYILTITSEGYANVKEDLLFRIYDILTRHKAELAYPTTQLEFNGNTKFELSS